MEIRCQRAGACFGEIKVRIVNHYFKQSLGDIKNDLDSSITACRTWLGGVKASPSPVHSRGPRWDGRGALGTLASSSPVKSKRIFETPTPLSQPLLKNSIRACPGIPEGR